MKNQPIKFTTVACLILLGAIACSSSDDDSGTVENTDITSMPVGDENSDGASSDPTGLLDGSWISVCDSGGQGTLTFSGNTATTSEIFYIDDNCTIEDTEEEVFSNTLSIEFPGGSTETNLGTAFWIDMQVETISIDGSPAPPDVVEFFEAVGAFDTVFDIFLIANDGSLRFGANDSNDAQTSPETRPMQLENDIFFVRQ